MVSKDPPRSADHPSRLNGQGFRIPLRNRSRNNRSPSLSSPSSRKHRLEKKKLIRHSSSSVSSISSSSSSSRSRSRRYKKRHHRLRSVSRHCGHRHSLKRQRIPSSSSDRRSQKPYNERADVKSVSPIRHSLLPSPSRSTVTHEISLTVRPQDDDFQSPSKSNFKKPHITDSQFHSNVDPSDFIRKFPRKETGTEDNSRPKSSIEAEIVINKKKKEIIVTRNYI